MSSSIYWYIDQTTEELVLIMLMMMFLFEVRRVAGLEEERCGVWCYCKGYNVSLMFSVQPNLALMDHIQSVIRVIECQ